MNRRFVGLITILLIVVLWVSLPMVHASGALDSNGPEPTSVYKNDNLNNPLPSPTEGINNQLVRISDSIAELAHKKDYTLLSVLVAFLIGLAGVFKLDEKIKKKLDKPILGVSIKPEPPYSLKIPMQNRQTGATWQVYYYRFKVENTGNVPMENVEVFAQELYQKDDTGQYVKINNFLPMNLVWEQNHEVTRPKIQPDLFKHCDFGHITAMTQPLPYRTTTASVFFVLSTEVQSFNASNILVPGEYRIKVTFAATNIRPVTKWYELIFKDFWSDDEPTMLGTALTITELPQNSPITASTPPIG